MSIQVCGCQAVNVSRLSRAVVCALLFASVASAQVQWTGSGNDGDWSNGANWSTGAVPPNGSIVQFNAVGGDISITNSCSVQQLFAYGPAGVTLNIAEGVLFVCDNGGSTGIRAQGANITINGPGLLGLSQDLDCGANPGYTLAYNAQIVAPNGSQDTNIETYIGGAPNYGTVIMGCPTNAFTRNGNFITTGHTVVAPKLANVGQPSSLGANNELRFNWHATLRYTGTGDSTDRPILLTGGGGNNNINYYGGQIEQAGTGPLFLTGPIYNENNSAQELVLKGDSPSPARITGNIYNNQNTLAVRKEGAGTWTLSGNNTFTGGITINGGTLALDAPTAHGSVAQITMGATATLSVNPSATDSFNVTLPPVVSSGNIKIVIAKAANASTVTLGGLTAAYAAITAPGAGTPANRIFVTGLAQGPVGSWLTLNGSPAGYDSVQGLTEVTLPTQGLATRGSTLPNNDGTKALINTIGTVGAPPIALPADPTTLHSLTQTVSGDDATVDTAGKTLMLSEAAIAAGANALTIGVAPQDGLLLPPIQLSLLPPPPVIPDSTAISNLNPIIWYDPSEPENVSVLTSVTRLLNKGSAGSALDAVIRSGWTGPLYATGADSHSALPMIKIDANNQGLLSLGNTGITGNNPRTFIAVMSRSASSAEIPIGFGNNSSGQDFTIIAMANNVNLRFNTYRADYDTPTPPAGEPFVATFFNVDGFPNTLQGAVDGVLTPTWDDPGNNLQTANTPLKLGYKYNENAGRGLFGEVLLFDYSLDDTQRETVEAYLIAKWKQPAPPASAAQNATFALRNDSAAPLTVNAAVNEYADSSVSLLKWGPGDVLLKGGVSISGGVDIDGGALTVSTPTNRTDILSGVTSGNGKLAKTGPGTLFLPPTVANLHMGGTDITGGTLVIGNSRSLGIGPVTISGGGTLDLGAGLTTDGLTISTPVTVSGAGFGGMGAIVNNGSFGQMNAFRDTTVTLAGDTTVGGTARWDFRANVVLDLGGNTLTKVGPGPLNLFGGGGACVLSNAPSAKTAVHIKEGSVGLELAGLVQPNDPQRVMAIDPAARFSMYATATPLHWTIQPADGAEISSYGTDENTNKNVIASDIVLPGTLYLTSSGANYNKHLSGQISGPGGLSLTNGGIRAMSLLSHPDNLFGGPVLVSNAALGLRHPGSFPGGLAAIPANLTLLDNGAIRTYIGADGWTPGQVSDIAQSGIFNGGNNKRLQVDVAPGESASLPSLSGFEGNIDKYGTGALALDADLTLINGDLRTFDGTLLVTNAVAFDAGWRNLYLGEAIPADGIANGYSYARFGGDATLFHEDRGYYTGSSAFHVATHNSKVVLDVTDNAQVAAKIFVGGWDGGDTAAFGAVYQSGNTRWLNLGGGNNDSRIGHNGYGYWQIDSGELAMKGWTQLGSVNNGASAGILRQTGGTIVYNGERYTTPPNSTVGDSYGGPLGLSRGGKAELHLSGGTFECYGTVAIIDNNAGGNNIAATMTVDGTADAMIDRQLEMGYGTGGTASLNLNGGKLTATHIVRRNANGATANLNFNGGTLCVTNGTEVRLAVLENPAIPLNAYIYEGGATIDIAEGITRRMDTPLQAASGQGIVSIPVANGGSGYIAPPYVHITGGNGNGATAVAHIDRVTGEVTDIEITCPGRGYTANPTVNLIGGGGTGATPGTAVCAINAPGGLTKTGPGTLILNAQNTYKGPTVIESGTLRLGHPGALHPQSEIIIHDGTLDLGTYTITVLSVTITGSGAIVNGNVHTYSAVKTGPGTATWDAGIETGAKTLGTPGLYEGYLPGYPNITDPNPGIGTDAIELTTTAANGNGNSGVTINGKYWPDNSTWVYTGYIWNRNDTNETWTFAKSFDDFVWVKIDDIEFQHIDWNVIFTTNLTVTPGPHPFEIRFGQGSGGVGANNQGWWQSSTMPVGIDFLGRNDNIFEHYSKLEDDGSGTRLTVDTGVDVDPTIRIEGGTLLLPSGTATPGLREGYLTDTQGTANIDLTTPNPGIPGGPVELTVTAANGEYIGNNDNGDAAINGKPWENYSTYVYTGYIWNRSGTNETWTFAKSFDDAIRINLNGQIWDHPTWNQVGKWQAEVPPGASPIEIRFGQGGGGMGVTSVTFGPLAAGNEWWAFTDIALVVDYLGRNENDSANYVKLETNDGLQDGPRLTLTADNPRPGLLNGIPVSASAGAVLDLGGLNRPGLILSPAGDDAIGEMTVTGTANNALNGVIYHVTIYGANADMLLFTDPDPIDLTGLTIKPSDLLSETPSGNNYVIATAENGFIGTPVLEGFLKAWVVGKRGNDLILSKPGTMLLLR